MKLKGICVLLCGLLCVGATGFEPATTWSQTRSATGLRYTPHIGFAILRLQR